MPLPSVLTNRTCSRNQASPQTTQSTQALHGTSVVHVTTSSRGGDPLPLFRADSSSQTLVKSPSLTIHHHQVEADTPKDPYYGGKEASAAVSMSKIHLRFSQTDPRYKFRLGRAYPMLNFALVDATKSGPIMTVYRAETVFDQLYHESIAYLDENISFGRFADNNTRDREGSLSLSVLSIALSSRGQKKEIQIPQQLFW